MAKIAAELMAELANDKQHQANKAEKEKNTDDLKMICEQDEKELVRDINSCGFSVKSIWDFVNSKNDYLEAVPVLEKHLKVQHHPKILAGLARSLAISSLSGNDELWSTLADLYRVTSPDNEIDLPENRGTQQAIAVAIEELANSSRIDSLRAIIQGNPNADGIDWLKDKLKKLQS